MTAPVPPAYAKSPKSMPPANQPDIAVAQDWMYDLDMWVRANELVGYDPFDVKQHPLIRAAQPHALPRRLTSGACDLFPNLSRKLLRVAPTENPKSHALLTLGRARLFEATGDEEYLDLAKGHLAWLLGHSDVEHGELGWGYPFRVYAKGIDTPAGTPVLVVSAIAGQAFLRAHRLTGKDEYLDAARRIASFVIEEIPQLRHTDGTYCLGYTPEDRRRVHNANLLGVELLFRVGAACGESALTEAAEPALQFTLLRQREDGSWPYGEFSEGEAYDRANLEMVDHHHTGFVLRSLFAIQGLRLDPATEGALDRGFDYYRKHLFGPLGMPVSRERSYPVDIHACAEAILCPTVMSQRRPPALQLANLALRWTDWYLRDKQTGAPYYRKYRRFTSRLVCPRWGVAWMHRAVAEYLFALSNFGRDLATITGKTW